MLTCGPSKSASTSPALSQDRSTDWEAESEGFTLEHGSAQASWPTSYWA